MTTVAHISRQPAHVEASKVLYVGRPSDYGNPYKIGRDGDRDEVILKFKAWWLHPSQEALRKRALHECKDKTLLCWCFPEACHADVIAEYINGYWEAIATYRGNAMKDPPL